MDLETKMMQTFPVHWHPSLLLLLLLLLCFQMNQSSAPEEGKTLWVLDAGQVSSWRKGQEQD
jgi:hypothetical protein